MVGSELSHLATSVRVAQNIVLSKVAMGGENNNIENHGDSPKKLLKSAGVRSLKKVQK